MNHLFALLEKANFNPAQLRIPIGNPDAGQWVTDADDDAGGNPTEDQAHLELIAGKPLPPGGIRSLFRDYGGHHVFPLAEAQLRANVLSPEAIDVFSKETLGSGGQLKNQDDPDNPHRGRTTKHIEYSQGVRELTDRFIKDNGIDRNSPMTGDQARRLLEEIDNSKDPRIRRFTDAINQFIDKGGRENGPRLRGLGRGSRGRE